MIRISLLLVCVLISACAGSTGNPFGSNQANVSDVYYDYFRDIPIVTGLKIDPDRSLITLTQDGSKVGLLTLEGNLDQSSLMNAMAHNMLKHEWKIAGSIVGPKALQIYRKNGLFAVLYYYDQLVSTGMEIWVGAEVDEGAYTPLVPAMPQDRNSSNTSNNNTYNNTSTSADTDDSLMYESATYPVLDTPALDATDSTDTFMTDEETLVQ